jgi:hypothetical protein
VRPSRITLASRVLYRAICCAMATIGFRKAPLGAKARASVAQALRLARCIKVRIALWTRSAKPPQRRSIERARSSTTMR